MIRALTVGLLFAVAASADLTEFSFHEIRSGNMSVTSVSASGDQVRVLVDDNSGFPKGYYPANPPTGSTSRRFYVSLGFVESTTVYLQLQHNTGGGYVSVDCNALAAFDGVPEIGPTVTCEAGGYLSIALPADHGLTPVSPAAPPTPPANWCAGTILAASSCADVQTDINAIEALTPDGAMDCLAIPWDAEWRDCPELTTTASPTNTDAKALTSSRWNDNRCPSADEVMTEGSVVGCAPTLSKDGQADFIEIDGNWWIDRLHITVPPLGHPSYGEGGAIVSVTPNGGNLELGIPGHNFGANQLVVWDDSSDGSCTFAGTYQSDEFTLLDGNTVSLTGVASGACPDGYAYQDPAFNNNTTKLIDAGSTNNGGIIRSFIETPFPARHFTTIAGGLNENMLIAQSTIHFGTWGPYSGSGVWQRDGIPENWATTAVFRGRTSKMGWLRNYFFGNGIGVFVDGNFAGSRCTADWTVKANHQAFPDEWLSANRGIGLSGRGHFWEFKELCRGSFIGLSQFRVPRAPNNSNTTGDLLAFRNNLQAFSSTTIGTHDIDMRSLVGYQTPQLVFDEGGTNGRASLLGRFRADNLLLNEPREIDELGTFGASEAGAGHLYNFAGRVHNRTVTRFTRWRGDEIGSTIGGAGPTVGSNIHITNGVFAGEPYWLFSDHVLFRNSQAQNMRPRPDTEAADAFGYSFDALGLGSSTFGSWSIAGGVASNGASYDTTGVTQAEVADEVVGVDFSIPGVENFAGATANARIAAMDCDANFVCANVAAGRGFVRDEYMADAEVVSAYTGDSDPMAHTRIDDDTIEFRFRAPAADTSCVLRWRPVGSTAAYSTAVSATGARDRTVRMVESTHAEQELLFRCGVSELRTRARTGGA